MEFLARVDELLAFSSQFKGSGKLHIAFSSLIPSPRTKNLCEASFLSTDLEVRQRVRKYTTEMASFLNLEQLVRFKDNSIKEHLFYDGIHLNWMATRWLAEHILKFIRRIPLAKV